jgi:putative FmdB family regulatory protein
MIAYQYECLDCGSQFEIEQRLTDNKLTEYLCNECHCIQPVKRIIVKSNFVLLGGGWGKDGYIKDIDLVKEAL